MLIFGTNRTGLPLCLLYTLPNARSCSTTFFARARVRRLGEHRDRKVAAAVWASLPVSRVDEVEECHMLDLWDSPIGRVKVAG